MTELFWTDARVATVRRLLKEGFSCSYVANFIGATRNAVIGKVRRLEIATAEKWDRTPGTNYGPRTWQRPRKPTLRPEATTSVQPLRRPLPAIKPDALAYKPGSLATIFTVKGCRWEITDSDSAKDFRFCNAEIERGSYCAFHAQVNRASYGERLVRKTIRQVRGMR